MSDLISREEVLDYIDNMPSELNAEGHRMIRRIRLTEYITDTLPSAESEAYNLGWKEGREALRKEIWEDGRDRLD